MTHTDPSRRKIFTNNVLVVCSIAMIASSHFALAASHTIPVAGKKTAQQQQFLLKELGRVVTEAEKMSILCDQAVGELDANGTSTAKDFFDLTAIIKKLDDGRHIDPCSSFIGILDGEGAILRMTLLQMKEEINGQVLALKQLIAEIDETVYSDDQHLRIAMAKVEGRRKLWSYLETDIGDLMKVMSEFHVINNGQGSLFNFSSPALAAATLSNSEGKFAAA